MKKLLLPVMALMIVCQSCQTDPKTGKQPILSDSGSVTLPQTQPDSPYTRFISIDSGNKMLNSYLTSIGYPDDDSDLHSIVLNVAQLRRYLDSKPDSITRLKLMFAHTLDYINTGHGGEYAGYNPNALTLIIAACNQNGDYVFFDTNYVLDYGAPCPTNCPPGNAESPLLSQ